jgi:hypothetical protein
MPLQNQDPPQKQKSDGSQQLKASIESDNSITTDRSGAPPYKQNAAQRQDPFQKQSVIDPNGNS